MSWSRFYGRSARLRRKSFGRPRGDGVNGWQWRIGWLDRGVHGKKLKKGLLTMGWDTTLAIFSFVLFCPDFCSGVSLCITFGSKYPPQAIYPFPLLKILFCYECSLSMLRSTRMIMIWSLFIHVPTTWQPPPHHQTPYWLRTNGASTLTSRMTDSWQPVSRCGLNYARLQVEYEVYAPLPKKEIDSLAQLAPPQLRGLRWSTIVKMSIVN